MTGLAQRTSSRGSASCSGPHPFSRFSQIFYPLYFLSKLFHAFFGRQGPRCRQQFPFQLRKKKSLPPHQTNDKKFDQNKINPKQINNSVLSPSFVQSLAKSSFLLLFNPPSDVVPQVPIQPGSTTHVSKSRFIILTNRTFIQIQLIPNYVPRILLAKNDFKKMSITRTGHSECLPIPGRTVAGLEE